MQSRIIRFTCIHLLAAAFFLFIAVPGTAFADPAAQAAGREQKVEGLSPDEARTTAAEALSEPARQPQATTATISVQPLNGLVTSESGESAAFEVSLDSLPAASVIISLSVSDASEGHVSPASLTFEPAGWEAPQQFTVTGVDDDYDDGDQPYLVVTGPVQSEDPAYNNLDLPDVQVTNTDEDTAGIFAELLPGPTATTEGGGAVQVRVYLSSIPTDEVRLQLGVNPSSEGQVSPTQLVFQAHSADLERQVTVTGVDDFFADGNVQYSLMLAPAESEDLAYDGLDANDLNLINLDDDEPGLELVPEEGLVTTESGMADSFQVMLTSRPTQAVTVHLSSSDPGEGVVHPSRLDFVPEHWNEYQTVTVTGVDDFSADGNQAFQITARAVSADLLYHDLSAAAQATNSDNDTAGITIDRYSGLLTTESGNEASFTVLLNTRPEAPVRLNFNSTNPGEGEVITPMPLVFSPDNWDEPREVIVVGVDDEPDAQEPNDGDQVYTIQTQPAESQDDQYDGLHPAPVEVINQDDDGPRLEWILPTIDEGTYNIEEGEPVLLQVALLDSLSTTAEVEFLWWDALANYGNGLYVPLGSDYQASSNQPGVYAIEVSPRDLNSGWNQVFAIGYDSDGDESQVKPYIWIFNPYPIFMPQVVQ